MSKSSYVPNSFQTPNAIVDRLMHLLSDSELRVLLYAIRHTLGWRKKADSCRARISLSNFTDGFSHVDPQGHTHVYAGCGLTRSTVTKALKELVKYRILKKVGDASSDGQLWELAFMTEDDVDEEGLISRADQTSQKRKRQTAKGRKAALRKHEQSVEQTTSEGSIQQTDGGLSNRPGGSIQQTDGGLSNRPNETHGETHKGNTHKTQDSAPAAHPQPDSPTKSQKKKPRDRLFDGVALCSFDIPVGDTETVKPFGARIGKIVAWLRKLEEAPTPEELNEFYKWYRVEYRGINPPRDVTKFAEFFTAFRKRNQHSAPATATPVEQMTERQLAALKNIGVRKSNSSSPANAQDNE